MIHNREAPTKLKNMYISAFTRRLVEADINKISKGSIYGGGGDSNLMITKWW